MVAVVDAGGPEVGGAVEGAVVGAGAAEVVVEAGGAAGRVPAARFARGLRGGGAAGGGAAGPAVGAEVGEAPGVAVGIAGAVGVELVAGAAPAGAGRGGAGSAAAGGAAGDAPGASACARPSASSAASRYIGRGAYASFGAMASEPREVWGDLATSAFVQSNHLFHSLDDEARADLLRLSQCQAFRAGEVVLRQGEEQEDFFLVLEGVAAVTMERAGRVLELGLVERGGFFGEFRVLTGAPHTATVTARTDVTVVRFPSPMITALSGRYPEMTRLLEAVKAARERENAAKLSG